MLKDTFIFLTHFCVLKGSIERNALSLLCEFYYPLEGPLRLYKFRIKYAKPIPIPCLESYKQALYLLLLIIHGRHSSPIE